MIRQFFQHQQKYALFVVQINKKLHLCECNLFEVGGKNKKRKQIADIPNSFLVKDDIEYMVERTIPLWMFGLMY